jgi:hypothetical protein
MGKLHRSGLLIGQDRVHSVVVEREGQWFASSTLGGATSKRLVDGSVSGLLDQLR